MSLLRSMFQKSVRQRYEGSPASVEIVPEGPAETSALAAVPVVECSLSPFSRIVCATEPDGLSADRFRFLRMRLRERRNAGKLKNLLITSPLAHDGKSTIILNLATVLAERGRCNVLVVEADLHHACLVRQLGILGWLGLSDCLQGHLPATSGIRRLEPLGWSLLPAGKALANATELLQTPALGSVINGLSSHFDWVLVDSPPILPLTDALALQQHTDASLLVVRAGVTPAGAVEEALSLLGRGHTLGMVLNGIEGLDSQYVKYGYYRKSGQESNLSVG